MIAVDDTLIDKLCTLSRLEFTGTERDEIKNDLQNILNMMQQVADTDTSGLQPLIHMTQETNRFREDQPLVLITKEEALKNAPKRDSDYFRVPKFVEKS